MDRRTWAASPIGDSIFQGLLAAGIALAGWFIVARYADLMPSYPDKVFKYTFIVGMIASIGAQTFVARYVKIVEKSGHKDLDKWISGTTWLFPAAGSLSMILVNELFWHMLFALAFLSTAAFMDRKTLNFCSDDPHIKHVASFLYKIDLISCMGIVIVWLVGVFFAGIFSMGHAEDIRFVVSDMFVSVFVAGSIGFHLIVATALILLMVIDSHKEFAALVEEK